MVLLTTTPGILQAIAQLSDADAASFGAEALPTTSSDPISHTTLIRVARLLRSRSSTSAPPNTVQSIDSAPATDSSAGSTGHPPQPQYTLSVLLRSTKLYTPPPPAPLPRSPSYLALRARLLAAQEAKAYNALLSSNLASSHLPSYDEDSNAGENSDDDDISPSLILNILLSIVLCGFAIWYATRFFSNPGLRVLVSMAGAIVVGIAEAVVYAAYLSKVKQARRKERRRGMREKKEFLREIKGTGEDGDHEGRDRAGDEDKDDDDGGGIVLRKGDSSGRDAGQREIIWGKGVNGGVRRRVREKWEKEQQEPDG